jgi:hypothetical protein
LADEDQPAETLTEALDYERKTLAIDLHALDRDPKDADTKGDVASDYSANADRRQDWAGGRKRWPGNRERCRFERNFIRSRRWVPT